VGKEDVEEGIMLGKEKENRKEVGRKTKSDGNWSRIKGDAGQDVRMIEKKKMILKDGKR
jgi:hypothetical protein